MKYDEWLLRNIRKILANLMEKVKLSKKSVYVVRRKDAKHFSPSKNKKSLYHVSRSRISLTLVQ